MGRRKSVIALSVYLVVSEGGSFIGFYTRSHGDLEDDLLGDLLDRM